jgi:hypothetical protein
MSQHLPISRVINLIAEERAIPLAAGQPEKRDQERGAE